MIAKRLLIPMGVVALWAMPAMAAGLGPTCSVSASIAGGDQNVNEITPTGQPTEVLLNSDNSKKDATSLTWEQTGGTHVDLTYTYDSSTGLPVKASFKAPDVGTKGETLKFMLTVKGCNPEVTATKTVSITVLDVAKTNLPPVASAVAPETVNEGDLVELDGSTSSDPNGDPLTYFWKQTDGPLVTLLPTDNPAKVTFIAPNDAYPNGVTRTFTLTVSDGLFPDGLTDSINKSVTVKWVNDPPKAVLICPSDVNERQLITLNGAGSSDSDDGIAKYEWSQLHSGPIADLSNVGSTSIAEFEAPSLASNINAMRFELKVTDNSGLLYNTATCDVNVLDITPPAINVPENITAEAQSAEGASVTFQSKATDAVDGDRPVTCMPVSGSIFALDQITSVTCTASDASNNSGSASFTVKVVDTTAPALKLPAPIGPVEGDTLGGAVVTYTATAFDLVDGTVSVTCDKATGSVFPVGSSTVSCSATDGHINTTIASFNIYVVDTIPPTIAAHSDVTAEATSASGAIVTYASPATSDIVDGPGTASCAPASGVGFALGTTTVICGASDKAGNAAATTSFKVTVQDTTAPVVTAPAPVTAKATGPLTSVNIGTATATDAVGVVSLTNDAPATFPVGSTTVTWTAKDAAGNIGTAKQTVAVEYNWAGFFSPINNDVVNKVKAGSAIPVKFSLGGNMGLDVFAAGYPISVTATNFDGVIAVNDITDLATVTAGGSSLTYDALANQYVYVWKTDKSWAGTSRQLQVRLKDGTVHVANFTFAK